MLTKQMFLDDDDPRRAAEIFFVEEKALQTDRFSVKMTVEKNGLRFSMSANDEVAFKTVNTSMKKLISLYQKIKQMN